MQDEVQIGIVAIETRYYITETTPLSTPQPPPKQITYKDYTTSGSVDCNGYALLCCLCLFPYHHQRISD